MTASPSCAGRWSAFWSWLAPITALERRIDVVAGVTFAILLLSTEETWVIRVGVVSLAVAGIVDRRLLRSAAYWFAMLAVYVVGVSGLVVVIDNHEFLLGYWLLALALSRLLADPSSGLATSARLLIGFSFAFAVLWKGLTPDYTSGNAFHSFLLFDPRFIGVGPALSGLSFAEATANYDVSRAVLAIGDADAAVPVFDAPGVRRVALGMTWWTLAIEGLVAVCFLAPPRSFLGRARHVVLLAFLVTTYVLAPVMGYGWLLIALGVAQAPIEKHRPLLPAFAVAFVLVAVRGTAPIGRLVALL